MINEVKGIFWALLICAIITMCSGSCRTRHQPPPTVTTTTSEAASIGARAITHAAMEATTSDISLADTTRTYAIADTVYTIRTATRTIQRILHQRDTLLLRDTVRLSRRDTITITAQPQAPPQQRTLADNLLRLSLSAAAAAFAAYIIIYIRRRRERE